MENLSVVPTIKRPPLEEVLTRFETWRKRKKPGSRIPKSLWAAAVHLCEVHSICEVSGGLRPQLYGAKRTVRRRDAGGANAAANLPTLCGDPCVGYVFYVRGRAQQCFGHLYEDDLPGSGPPSRSGCHDPWFLEPQVLIQITPQMRILVALEPQDFRKGIDGLGRICRELLREDPFSGCVFVFRNKAATSLKVVIYDGQGFWLCQKQGNNYDSFWLMS